MKAEKREFIMSIVAFLGYILEKGQLKPDLTKIKAVLD